MPHGANFATGRHGESIRIHDAVAIAPAALDRDDMVSFEHTAALFRAIPGSELAVVPGASHAVFMEKPELVNRLILDFLENEPVATMLPIRRAAADVATH